MKPRLTGIDVGKISDQIASLDSLGTAPLQERRLAPFGTEPHSRLGRELLIRAVAYKLQEKTSGGVDPTARRLLERVGADETARRPKPARRPSPGTC